MPLRPASVYRDKDRPAYTKKEYITGIPGMRIAFFDMGNPEGDFPIEISLVAEEEGQIRHNALEAARLAANRLLENEVGKSYYHLKIRVYPHQILRENPMAIGAGADRISDGMRKAFGRPVGVAARISAGQKILTVRTTKEAYEIGKEALRRASMKFPMPCRRSLDKGEEYLTSTETR